MSELELGDYQIRDTVSVNTALVAIEKSKIGGICVVDSRNHLQGVVTDGDIRRILASEGSSVLAKAISEIAEKKFNFVWASQEPSFSACKELSDRLSLKFIPVLNDDRSLASIFLPTGFTHAFKKAMLAVMAGGEGKRLQPITHKIPKCLVAVNGKALLGHIFEAAAAQGFYSLVLSVNYLKEQVFNYCSEHPLVVSNTLDVQFIEECAPLGSFGSMLGYASSPHDSIIVTNCDLFPIPDYSRIFFDYLQSECRVGAAISEHSVSIPFGVVHSDHGSIVSIEEKPKLLIDVLVGVYCIEKSILSSATSKYCDAPCFISELAADGVSISTIKYDDQWLDVGRHDTLSMARKIKFDEVE